MALIIDGYNLLHASGIIPRGVGPGGLERARAALLNFVVEALEPQELRRAVVVFDAASAPHGLPRQIEHRGLAVHFASQYEDADALIEELIQADSSPRQLTVVSSDHRLHRAARRRKATAIDSDQWHRDMINRRRERTAARQGAGEHAEGGYITPGDVDFWLHEFSQGAEAKLPDSAASQEDASLLNPFPPGYGEDLLEGEE